MGPKTTAPDNAPSAASPTRSPASVADGTHQIAITAATTIFFMLYLPAIHARSELRLLHFARVRTGSCSQSSAKLQRWETAWGHVNTASVHWRCDVEASQCPLWVKSGHCGPGQ